MSSHPDRTRHPLLIPLVLIIAGGLPALADPGAISRAARLFPLAESAGLLPPWSDAGLLLVWYPLVALSAMILLLGPGLVLSLALRTSRHFGEWLLHGLGFSLVLVSGADLLVNHGLGAGLHGRGFAGLVLVLTFGLAALTAWRWRLHEEQPRPWQSAGATTDLALLLLAGLALLAGLGPKVLWEAFNGDGAHGYEATRLLLNQPVPFWPEDAGNVAAFPGLTSVLFVFPGSWFVRLFGEYEAAVRIPGILYVLLTYGVLCAVIEEGRARALGTAERLLVGLPLLAYLLTMAYSATYNPYSADLALPLTQDTLSLLCFLGFILCFAQGRAAGIVIFAVLTHISSPNGLLLLGFWLVASFLMARPRPTRALRATLVGLVACVLVGALVPRLLLALGQPAPGREYALLGLLRRFAFLQFTDWQRVLFVAVPCGLLPLLLLPRFRGQDGLTRTVSLVTLGYFGFFYVQAYISLHHLVPAMVLPLVVLWRHDRIVTAARPALVRGAVLASGILALVLAAPRVWRPHLAGRQIGATIEVRIPGYERSSPAVFRHAELLNALFPVDYQPEVPAVYGGSSLTWLYYAERFPGDPAGVNYVLQDDGAPPPEGMQPVASDSGATLYLRDPAILADQRALRPATPAGSPVFWSPRGLLFRSVPLEDGPWILDVPAFLVRLGLPVDRWLGRMGVER